LDEGIERLKGSAEGVRRIEVKWTRAFLLEGEIVSGGNIIVENREEPVEEVGFNIVKGRI
jgi:hypothetical protein